MQTSYQANSSHTAEMLKTADKIPTAGKKEDAKPSTKKIIRQSIEPIKEAAPPRRLTRTVVHSPVTQERKQGKKPVIQTAVEPPRGQGKKQIVAQTP